jgi:hypothetical protein
MLHFYRPDYKKLAVLRVRERMWGEGFTEVNCALLFLHYLDDLPQDTYYGTDGNLSLARSEGCDAYSWHEGTLTKGWHIGLYGTSFSQVSLFFLLKFIHKSHPLLFFLGPNLVYKVLPKPDSHEALMDQMAKWILANYPTNSGIIYCLTKKETTTIAGDLYRLSHGQLRCGLYHSEMSDVSEKKRSMYVVI